MQNFNVDSYEPHSADKCRYCIYNGFLAGDIQDMIDALTVAENAEKLKETEKGQEMLALHHRNASRTVIL